jgi:hypothetical protein
MIGLGPTKAMEILGNHATQANHLIGARKQSSAYDEGT